jgi:hypothetical protein
VSSFKQELINGFNFNRSFCLYRTSTTGTNAAYDFITDDVVLRVSRWDSSGTCSGEPDSVTEHRFGVRAIASPADAGNSTQYEWEIAAGQRTLITSPINPISIFFGRSDPSRFEVRGQCHRVRGNPFPNTRKCDESVAFGYVNTGSAAITICPCNTDDCRRCGDDCEHCDDCEEFPCEGRTCCTPVAVRSTASSVTTPGVGTCIMATTESYKVAGSTAINRTLDLGQVLGTPCKFSGAVSSNYVLRRATKFAIDTLTYRAEIVSSTQWRMRVIGSGSGHSQTVEFFDGTATITAGLCNALATANNSFTSCSLTANPKRGGHSGTFAKPSTATSGTSCSHCSALTTPSSFSATIASVTVCTMQCDGSRWRLTGTTAINRNITLSQVGGSPCVFEATVSADYVLFDHDTAAESWANLLLIYELERTSSGNGTWEIYGEDSSGNKRVSFAGANSGGGAVNPMTVSGFSANNCKDWPTASHPTRSASADQTNHTVIVGSAGSTVFSACPDE